MPWETIECRLAGTACAMVMTGEPCALLDAAVRHVQAAHGLRVGPDERVALLAAMRPATAEEARSLWWPAPA